MTNTFILLLRGVNVGGANSLSAANFVRILEALGLKQVKTYIQSGNAVFQCETAQIPTLCQKMRALFQRRHGLAPEIVLLRLDELEHAIAANPYAGADADPKALHLTFLVSAPKDPDFTSVESVREDAEHYSLKGRVFYFWAPAGIGRSKAFSRIEKALKTPGTARNWRTVCKLRDLAREIG